jgi:hypothetical protein
MVERVLPTVDSKFALFFTMWHRNTPYFIVPLAMDKVSHMTCDVGIYTDKPVEHLSVNMLVPFWGGTEMDMDERKKQELVKIKGRMQVARARARGVRVPTPNGKHHMRNLSGSPASHVSPLLFNNPLGLTRSLTHSQSHPVLSVSRTHPPRHSGNSPHISILPRPSSPLSPHSPRSPLAATNSPPRSPRSPRSGRANANNANNTNTNTNNSNNANNNTIKSPNTNNTTESHGSPIKSSPLSNNSPHAPSGSKSPSKSPQGDVYYSKYKEKMKYMKQLMKLKDEELARVRVEMNELLSGNKKSSNVSYYDFLPPPVNK